MISGCIRNIFERHLFTYLVALSLRLDPGMEAFCLNSVALGHHIYKDIWNSVHGEELHCEREIGNVQDLYAVSIIKHGTGILGHLPKRISTPCHLFLRKEKVFLA